MFDILPINSMIPFFFFHFEYFKLLCAYEDDIQKWFNEDLFI